MLGSQEPEPDQVARDLIRQQLADAAFNAERIEFFAPIFSQGSEAFQLHDRALRVKLIEFFFGVRTG